MSDYDAECLFCKIVAGDLPAEKLYDSDDVVAFRDVSPQAPFHALVIPRAHIPTLDAFEPAQTELAGRLLLVAQSLAAEHSLPGYRVAMNVNSEGGQVIFHAHLHLLGGRQMRGQLG